jgi:lysophospholipase L1-like esterase
MINIHRLNRILFSGENMWVQFHSEYNYSKGRTYFLLGILLSAVFTVASCGGGGGGDSSPTAPPAPTRVTATAGVGEATIGWDDVAGATSYNIYHSKTTGVTKANGTKITGATSPNIVPGLTNGTPYYFVVTAVNAGGEGVESSQVSATPTTVLSAPTGVTAMAGNGEATIGWSALAGATSYNIYYSTTPGVTKATGNRITGVTSPTTFTGLINNTTYYFVVTAVNAVGESPESSQVSASPNIAPTAPTGVSATPGHGEVTVGWSAAAGATSYNIYYSTTSGVTNVTGIKVSGVNSPKIVTGLTNGTTYYFVVTAVNIFGAEGPESSQVSATPTPAPPPLAPTGVTATAGDKSASISWFPVVGATSYNIYYSKTDPVTKATGTKVTGVTSPKVVTGLTIGTTYYFVATSENTDGESVFSAQVSAIPFGEYIAVGDSITYGTGDDISTDGFGYEPILANLLGITVQNEGVPGVDSAYGAAHISETLLKYPAAKFYLVLYGTNDANILGPAVARDVYKSNMRTILSAILAAGKTPCLAKVPYTTNPGYDLPSIQEYNKAIDELVTENHLTVPPDFYTLYQNTSFLNADGLHPNGTGYQSMANLWFEVLP